MLYQSQALLDGDDEEGEAVVAAARASIIYKLTATEVESAADVNKAIIQLQMLRIVSEARPLHWPKLSARAPFTGMSCRLLSDLLVIHTKLCSTNTHQHVHPLDILALQLMLASCTCKCSHEV